MKRLLPCLVLATLSGCASLHPTPPAAPAPLEPPAAAASAVDPQAYIEMPVPAEGPARGGLAVSLPSPRERLKHLALQEWTLWGRGRWQLQSNIVERPAGSELRAEHEPAYVARVLHYWYSFKGGRDFAAERTLFKDGSLLPWSAVFISYLMKTSGVGVDQFPPNESHWAYIRAILEAPNPRGFEALDANAQAPEEGDLICAPRDVEPTQQRSFAQLLRMSRKEREQGQPYHCDLVLNVTAQTVEALGGNVHESVMLSVVERDERGLLKPSAERPWSVLLRNHLR
jgi:hypothetical protein